MPPKRSGAGRVTAVRPVATTRRRREEVAIKSRIGFALLLGAMLIPPTANAAEPPIENLSPGNGAQIPVTPPIVTMDFDFVCPRFQPSGATSPFESMSYSVTVATSPELGPDGRLAKAFTVGYTRSTHPTNAAETECKSEVVFGGYRTDGTTYGELAPGTYYWDASRGISCFPEPEPCSEVGPIWSFTVVVPAAPSPPTEEVNEEDFVPISCAQAHSARATAQQRLIVAQRVMRRRFRRAQEAHSNSARRQDLRIARRNQRRVSQARVERGEATKAVRQACVSS